MLGLWPILLHKLHRPVNPEYLSSQTRIADFSSQISYNICKSSTLILESDCCRGTRWLM